MLASLLFSLSTGVRQEAENREKHIPFEPRSDRNYPVCYRRRPVERVAAKNRSEQLLRQEFAYRTQPIAIAPSSSSAAHFKNEREQLFRWGFYGFGAIFCTGKPCVEFGAELS